MYSSFNLIARLLGVFRVAFIKCLLVYKSQGTNIISVYLT